MNTNIEIKDLAKTLTWKVEEMRRQWEEVLKKTKSKATRHPAEELRGVCTRPRRGVAGGGFFPQSGETTANNEAELRKLDGNHAILVDPDSEDRNIRMEEARATAYRITPAGGGGETRRRGRKPCEAGRWN